MQQGLNVGGFPERMRVYIGGIFGGSYAATDGAETRRYDSMHQRTTTSY